jgi:hypothetical protein
MRHARSLLIALVALVVPIGTFAGEKAPPFVALQAQLNALAAHVATLESQVSTLRAAVHNQATQITALQTALGTIQTSSVMALSPYLEVTTDVRGPVARFVGVNLHLVNGSGQTYETPNGVGNLIIGYDALRPDNYGIGFDCSIGIPPRPNQTACEAAGGTWALNHKFGSHNLVVGDWHNYSQTGSVVFGFWNTVNHEATSVTGGLNNAAGGRWASVSGGRLNSAAGEAASVSGGNANLASGEIASVSGGRENIASGGMSSVSGGFERSATGPYNWAAGPLWYND